VFIVLIKKYKYVSFIVYYKGLTLRGVGIPVTAERLPTEKGAVNSNMQKFFHLIGLKNKEFVYISSV